MPKTAKIILLATAVCFVFSGVALAGDWSNDFVKNEKIAMTFYDEVVGGGYKAISTVTLKKWLDAKKPIFIVDTTPYKVFKKNHVPGAKNFTFPIPYMKSMKAADKAKFKKFLGPDKNRVLVFYCGFTKCTRSHNGAKWAAKLGYKNSYRCAGGIKGWMQRKYPVQAAK